MRYKILIGILALILLSGCILGGAEVDCVNNRFLSEHDISKGYWLSSPELMGQGLTGKQIVDIRESCKQRK